MCPMLLSSLREGPTMIVSPPQEYAFLQFPRQPKLDAAPGPGPRSLFSNGVNSSFSGSLSASCSATRPSRKRSRDDVAAENFPNKQVTTVPVPPPASQQEEPIYGEGMVLINRRTGVALSAESQTGTWYEEAMEDANAAAQAASSRNHASNEPSRKSQRVDPSGPGLDDITRSRIQRQLQENDSDDNRRMLHSSSSATRSSPFSPQEPLVDDATRLLGISWQRVQTDDADIAAAVRGWKRYIDRQFSRYLADAEILMKNRALNAYLVAARPMITSMGPAQTAAFYLFNDDLTQGQLVASSWEACLRNLQSSPILFEGAEVFTASDKPHSLNQHQNRNVLAANPADTGLPLLQTLTSGQPVSFGFGVGLNDSTGLGNGMDID